MLRSQESNNDALDRMVKNHSNMLDLCGPIKGCAVSAGRHLLMEGDLRLKDSQGKVSEGFRTGLHVNIYPFTE